MALTTSGSTSKLHSSLGSSILDVFDILTYSIDDGLMKVGIGLDEFRTETAVIPRRSVHQNLTVADITGPMPMVAACFKAFVISAAISVGTHSKTMAKAPASSKARASWIRRLAVSAFFPVRGSHRADGPTAVSGQYGRRQESRPSSWL